MSEENDKRLYKHFNDVIDGKFSTGNAVSNDLRISDAKRHLADLVKKRPHTIFEKPIEPIREEIKPKGKK